MLTTVFLVGASGNVGLWKPTLRTKHTSYYLCATGTYPEPMGAARGGAEYIAAARLMATIHCWTSV